MSKSTVKSNENCSMSQEGRNRLKRRESRQLKYYDDAGLGKGNCTFGIGIMLHRGPCTEEELGKAVSDGEVEMSFNAAIRIAENGIKRHVTYPLNQEQFDALVSYTFNRGVRGATPTFRLINLGRLSEAADNIERANKQNVVDKNGKRSFVLQKGLVDRRREESAPFRVESAEIEPSMCSEEIL